MNIMKWKGLDINPMKISESLNTKPEISQIETNFNESTQESGITVLYPRIEAIHAGRTRNYNQYTAEKLKGDYELKSGVYSWTQPYPKPVIHNHDTNTEATGRVHSATFTEFTAAGRPGIMVTPKISQEKAVKDILEGRLLTVSIGATTNAAICSICNTDIINEGFCGHMRGEEYEGQTAEWIAGDLWFDELSWVNVPADPDAMVIGNGLSNNLLSTGENNNERESINTTISHTTLGTDMSIVTGTIQATQLKASDLTVDKMAAAAEAAITSATTMLTPENEVVKSVSESTAKEEKNVETPELTLEPTTQETTEVTPEITPDATTIEAAPETTEEVEPVTTQEAAPVIEDTTADAVPAVEPEVQEAAPVEGELEKELAETKSELANALNTIEELQNANIQLAKANQESAATFLVDLRMAIGKEANREEAMVKFASRSIESLNDSIADILVEKPSLNQTRVVETVLKPGGLSNAESKTLATDKVKVISNEDVLLSLLGGK